VSKTKDCIDALTADLLANAGLSGVVTWVKYRPPRALEPQDCPAVIVRRGDKVWVPVGTGHRFNAHLEVIVEYHLPAVDEAVTLVDDETLSTALLDAAEAIEQRIRSLANEENTPAAGPRPWWEIRPGRSAVIDPRLQQGLTEGYAVAAICSIDETA
jgi:hypothetical protein